MLPVGWLVLAVVLAILLTMWVTFTVTRLDRLHARVDAAQAALDAQLVRRSAALQHVAQSSGTGLSIDAHRYYEQIAQAALDAVGDMREDAENAVGRAVNQLVEGPAALHGDAERELREAAARVLIARRFYNDAVRDTRSLRTRRMPRLLRLAGHRELPEFFDIDDTVPPDHTAQPDHVAPPDHPAQPDRIAPEHQPSTPEPDKEPS